MQDLQQAIDNYLAGKASEEEQQLVNNWYYAFDDENIEIPAEEQALREKIRDRIHSRLQQTLRGEMAVKGRTVTFYTKRIAAGIGLLIGLAGAAWLLHFFRKATPAKQVTMIANSHTDHIIPGGSRAVLLLANGDSILLDNAGNGVLSQQGGAKVIKLNNGALAYKASNDVATIAYNTIRTPRGGQYQVTLPDGTEVWLNAASALRFPTVFAGNSREVTLNGEGYFEVKPFFDHQGKKVPFIVKVMSGKETMNVKVLGTRFNIMAYEDENAVNTSLLEGSVAASNGRDSVMIRPGQRASLLRGQPVFKMGPADFKEILAWKNGEFRFREAGIKDIMRQLCRWYDVDVAYSEGIDQVKLSGIIPKTEDIAVLLDALQATGKIHFEVVNRKIIVHP
ncbi:MAG: FecR family protein [Chitinophaga sp.]|uniref:FecR family protein n=1 Tax=Chitinophaga sp. TaxID=1869181 RepID=UPI001B12FEDC|nr:FecR family protein [Chitinophaga sp.]MBO9728729.1 FecR family protein [Chitinophaga sp.]